MTVSKTVIPARYGKSIKIKSPKITYTKNLTVAKKTLEVRTKEQINKYLKEETEWLAKELIVVMLHDQNCKFKPTITEADFGRYYNITLTLQEPDYED